MADGKSRSHGKDKRASTSKRAPQPAARVRLPLLSREAALVADSEYFDAQWYAARYLRSSDVEPAEHYVSVGWREGHDPGPNFDTGWYLMVNGDVDAADLNPLVHFLEYGEREGRLPNPGRSSSGGHRSSGSDREDVGLVRDHPLFDAAWYAAQHPGALKPGEDPAEHYVRIGGHQGLDPSPRFRSRWYLETNDDVLHSGLNPLVHYIRYGRDEGRLPVPEQITAPNILAPEAALAVDPEDTISLEELAPVASRSLVTVGGTNIGLVTDGDPRAAKPLGALVGFAALHGWQTRYAIELQPASGVGRRHALPAFDLDNWRSLEEFTVSGAMISDLWFMAESQLRLRVEARDGPTFSRSTRLRCYQSDGVSLHLCREAEVSGDSPTFLDIDLINPFLPILVAATDTEDLLTDAMVVPFPSLLRGGLHHAEVAARGERATRTQDVRQISDALVRELLGWGDDRTPLALVRVDVDVQDATGAERIFSRPVIEWLARVMQIGLAPTNLNSIRLKSARMHLAEALAPPADLPPEAVQAISERRVKGTSLLTIPADSVPTIAALVSRRLTPHDTDTIPAPFLVADPITFRPSLWVSMPPLGSLGDLQPTNVATPFPRLSAKVPGAGRGSLDASVRAPLAIRLPAGREHSASALMPHAPDNDRPLFRTAPTLKNGQWPRVTAIIAGTGRVAPLARLLPSLANQTVFDSLDVIVALAVGQKAKTEQIQKVLAPLFGKSGKVVTPGQDRPSARLNAAARRAKGEYLFVLDEAMLLHDPRTIEALLTLAMQPGVASAGCMQLREVAASSDQFTSLPGGFFPARIAFGGAPSLIFDEPKTSGPLTRATFPVAANSLRATLVPAAVWRSAGGLDDETFPIAGYDLEFGLRTLKQGLGHLVTGAVSVTDLGTRTGTWTSDPVGIDYLPAAQWHEVASSVVVMRELR